MEQFTLTELLGMLGAPFLSMLVGWLTSSETPAKIKTWLLVGLSALYAVVAELAASGGAFNVWVFLVKFVGAFFLAAQTHSAFSKPLGISTFLQDKTGLSIGASTQSTG